MAGPRWSDSGSAGGQTLSVALTPLLPAPSSTTASTTATTTTTTTTGSTTTSITSTGAASSTSAGNHDHDPGNHDHDPGNHDHDPGGLDLHRDINPGYRQQLTGNSRCVAPARLGDYRDDRGAVDHDAWQSATSRDVDTGSDHGHDDHDTSGDDHDRKSADLDHDFSGDHDLSRRDVSPAAAAAANQQQQAKAAKLAADQAAQASKKNGNFCTKLWKSLK